MKTKWQYLVVTMATVGQGQLNALGVERWELVAIQPGAETIQLIFKRAV